MSTPTENSTNESTIGFVRVVLSRLKPDVKHKDLVPLLQVPLDALLKAMGGLITAKNVALDDQGYMNWALSLVTGPNLDKLMLKVAAHFGSKTEPGFQLIFPKTAAVVSNAPLRDQPGLLADIAKALNANDTPKEVKTLAKDWLVNQADYAKALTTLATADEGVTTATKSVKAARGELFIALATLRGQLIARNPRQPRVVASFYPRSPKKAKKVKPVAATPAAPVA